MKRGRRIAFHVAAGQQVGGGHLVRCLALADELHNRGWGCLLVCEEAVAPFLAWLPPSNVELAFVPPYDKFAVLDEMSRACVAVVDNYDWTAQQERALADVCRRVAVIDERLDRFHDVDLVVDMTPQRIASDYSALVPERCSLLLGSRYSLLRSAFPDRRDAVLADRSQRNGVVKHILISLGATANQSIYEQCLSAVGDVHSGLNIDVVVGLESDSSTLFRLAKEFAGRGGTVDIHRSTRDMAELMTIADLAIGAAGVSTWERCCLGLPSVVLQMADNQSANIEVLANAEAAVVLPRTSERDVADVVARSVKALSADRRRMCDMSAAAAALCDGRGAARVADWIHSEWSEA